MSGDRLNVVELDDEQEPMVPAVSDWMTMYLNSIGKCPLLTPGEELSLAKRVSKGDLAVKQRLVECNLKLVVNIAKAYSRHGVPLPDLIQEGNIGLMTAAESFDYRKGFRFSTYAAAWIRQAITRGIERCGYTIHIPSYVLQSLSKINRLKSSISAEIGRDPTIDELVACTQLPREHVIDVLRASEALVSSLDEGVDENACTALVDRLQDEAATDPELQALCRESERLTAILLTGLNAKEKLIIEKRFGLIDGMTATLQEIGEQLHITRERVRQLETKALKKLRVVATRNRLEEYFYY